MAEDETSGDELLTVADIAELTKASAWFVSAQIKDGHLRARRLGHSRLLRITKADFEEWLDGADAS